MPSSTFFNLPEEKRNKLLLCARAEFASVPYDQVSINRIIRSAGIPRGSFYMYFTDKNDLFHYLLENYGQRMEQLIEELLEECGGDLFSSFLSFFDFIQADCHDPAKRQIYADIIDLVRLNSGLQPSIFFSKGLPLLFQHLEAKLNPHLLDLRGGADLEDIFRILISVTGPALLDGILSDDPAPIRIRYANILDILARGMAKAPTPTVSQS